MELPRACVALAELPGSGALPRHGPTQGGQAEDGMFQLLSQIHLLGRELPSLLLPIFVARQLLNALATASIFWSKTLHGSDAAMWPSQAMRTTSWKPSIFVQ